MDRLNHIKVHGYRRLADVDLEIHPLTVLIGPNGAGKTSLLECLRLLSRSAQGQLDSALSDLGGISNVLTSLSSGSASWLSLEVRTDARVNPLHYSLYVAARTSAYEIQTESLEQQLDSDASTPLKHIDSSRGRVRYFDPETNKLIPPTWKYDSFESALSQAPKMFPAPEEFRSLLASLETYAALDVTPRSPVRLPQPMRPAVLPGANGDALVSCLYYLRETDPDCFQTIQDTLSAGFQDFEKLSFPPVAAGTLAMTWKDRCFSSPLYMHQLSEGTLRFLWLTTLLQSPELPAIVLIDEPEVSLHPALMSLLADLLREASARSQIIVASHSDRLVRFLHPNEVAVCDIEENGNATMRWGDQMNLEKWLADYSLDEIWMMNLAGGLP